MLSAPTGEVTDCAHYFCFESAFFKTAAVGCQEHCRISVKSSDSHSCVADSKQKTRASVLFCLPPLGTSLTETEEFFFS